MSRRIKVFNGQTLIDIAIQYGGCYEYIFNLMQLNEVSITGVYNGRLLGAGDELIIDDVIPRLTETNEAVAAYFKDNKLSVNTGFTANPTVTCLVLPEVSLMLDGVRPYFKASNGEYDSIYPLTFTYQWLQNFVPIEGETNQTFTPTIFNGNKRIGCIVTAVSELADNTNNTNTMYYVGLRYNKFNYTIPGAITLTANL